MLVSVILCTHNPRKEVLQQTLDGLKRQTLDHEQWELLLIDNGSKVAVDDFFLDDGLPMRIIREDTLGLTPARLRGIREAQGGLLVFVDDDNVLDPQYLQNAQKICFEHTEIGAFGGSIVPQFETPPEEWTRPYWYLLAIRETPEDHCSMIQGDADAEPCGAGLCVFRKVAYQYAKYLTVDPVRRALDRAGDSLASAGDMDLVYTAFDCGFGIGRFRSLSLKHLIPPTRLNEAYFLRIFEAMYYSGTILLMIRQRSIAETRFSLIRVLKRWKRFIFSNPFDRKMLLAERRGRQRALIDWKQNASR